MIFVWTALLIIFIIIEAATVQLVTVWFAAGSAGALIAALCHTPFYVQAAVFVLVSLAALIITRPLVKKVINVKKQPTNADRCIGQTGIVTERINNTDASGAVKINGLEWSARSSDGTVIEKDAVVKIESIEGAKLIVKKED